ncbi:MAG: M20 family metallo-hydrolase [Pseudomonadota bacterium]
MKADPRTLQDRLDALVAINPVPPSGACRMALTEDDRAGRDLFAEWAEAAGLTVTVDAIGNMMATLSGTCPDLEPVMSGSHLDTVATGGRFDGALGVVAALGVAEALAHEPPPRSLVVANFTNEEGARFAPDMLGSLVAVGGMSLDAAREVAATDGAVLGASLEAIGYAGAAPLLKDWARRPHAFVELHVEQGPVLDEAGIGIGAVTGVQGIAWREITFEGEANHAGATPHRLRRDAGRAALQIGQAATALPERFGDDLLATVGSLTLEPGLINVIPAKATLTVDLRHPDKATLDAADEALTEAIEATFGTGCACTHRSLARFDPVVFDERVVARIEAAAKARGLSHRRIISGAGHDAQMLARIAPAAMIFAPSIGGISHNPAETTNEADITAALGVLEDVLTGLCHEVP